MIGSRLFQFSFAGESEAHPHAFHAAFFRAENIVLSIPDHQALPTHVALIEAGELLR